MALEKSGTNDKAEAKAPVTANPEKLQSDSQADKSSQKPVAGRAELASKEESLFKPGNNAFSKPIENESKASAPKENAAAKDKGQAKPAKNEPSVIDLGASIERAKPATTAAKPEEPQKPDTRTDGRQIIDSSKNYWEDQVRSRAADGSFTGKVGAAGAKIMSWGVDAARAGHSAYQEIFPEGAIEPSRKYWQDVALNGAKEGGAWGQTKLVSAVLADSMLQLSGLGNVETGSEKVARGVNQGAPEAQVKSDLKALGIDTTLAALTFAPGVSGLKALSKGEGLYRTAAAGSEITGMLATESKIAGSVSGKLSTAIKDTLPSGGKLSEASIQNFVGRLEQIAAEYGIAMKQGGIIGESKGTIDVIEFSTKAGGKHEIAHAMQQLQSRATALEGQAARSGIGVQGLNQAERAAAYEKVVKPFENVAYNQHEMFAGAAHSWGFTAKNYAEILKSNVASFDKALSTATVPEATVKLASNLYGRLPDLLGRSQLAIGRNIGSPASIFLNKKNEWKDLI